jgi:hypothetical protein
VRFGETFELGEKLKVIGGRLQLGMPGPDVELDHLVPCGRSDGGA